MAALPENVKLRIVQALACFDTPTQASKDVKAEFGLSVAPQQCEAYDPNKRAGQRLSEKYRTIFAETRKTFLEDTSLIGVSHRAVRLRTLQRMIDKCELSGNVAMVAQLLEQVAKETGGAFTNKQKVEMNASVAVTKNPQDMTDEELAAIAAGGSAGTSD
jgi:hypothetical protein